MGHGGRRHHVRRTGTDGGRGGHHPAAARGFGESNGGVRHRLFVMRAEGRKLVADPVQRFAHAGHVAMAEDGPDPAEDRDDTPVDLGFLGDHCLDERLGHREADRGHGNLPVGRLP